MKKTASTLFIAVFLLAGHRASGQVTPMTQCDSLLTNGYDYLLEGLMQESYDTLRLFMEQCPFYVGNKYNDGVISWQVFADVDAAAQGWTAGGAERWTDFFSWLKKVLYYNHDTNWYCADVDDMLNAAQNDLTSQVICQYILQSGKCPVLAFAFRETLNGAIHDRHQAWLDSLGYAFQVREDSLGMDGSYLWPDSIGADTLAHPYDTTIPTLWQDSLEVLLGPQYAEGVQPSSPITSQALLSAVLIENPVVTDEIDISYQMGRTALVTMELRDILGRSVPLSYAKYQLESPGPHEATIPAPSLPSGTYYLRLTTDAGDAITLKVVKE